MFTSVALLSVPLWVLQCSLCTLNIGPLKTKKQRHTLHDGLYTYLKMTARMKEKSRLYRWQVKMVIMCWILIRNATLPATYRQSWLQPQSLGQLHACGSGEPTFLYLPDFSSSAVCIQRWQRIQPFLQSAKRQVNLHRWLLQYSRCNNCLARKRLNSFTHKQLCQLFSV